MGRHPRVGHGVDVHAFATDSDVPLVLAGAIVPGEIGLAGHSDADVVVHAVCDALLGAAGLGDLGDVFGTDDPDYAGADSQVFLAGVLARLAEAGWRVGNVDCTVVAEQPTLSPHRHRLQGSLASLLGVPVDQATVKTTSTDRLGATGRGEGIACLTVALLIDHEG